MDFFPSTMTLHVSTIQTVVIVRTPPVRPAARTDNYNIGIAAVLYSNIYLCVITYRPQITNNIRKRKHIAYNIIMYFSKRILCASTHFCVSIQKSVKDNMQLRAIIIIVIE